MKKTEKRTLNVTERIDALRQERMQEAREKMKGLTSENRERFLALAGAHELVEACYCELELEALQGENASIWHAAVAVGRAHCDLADAAAEIVPDFAEDCGTYEELAKQEAQAERHLAAV